MDRYLNKPIQVDELRQAIAKIHPQGGSLEKAGATAMASAAVHSGLVLDRGAILARLGRDPNLLRDLVELFLRDCPGILDAICRAVAAGDTATLRRSAHTLKGSAMVLGAQDVVEKCQQLETMARSGDLTKAAETYGALERDVELAKPALSALVWETMPEAKGAG